MTVTPAGEGLCVVCLVESHHTHGWMSFALYYSLLKNLPDAKFVIACKQASMNNAFAWAFKRKIPFYFYDVDPVPGAKAKLKADMEYITIPSHSIAVREYRGNAGPVLASDSGDATFVDYSMGCGRFVLSSWIHKTTEPPFFRAVRRFRNESPTVNELKVLQVWERCDGVYKATL